MLSRATPLQLRLSRLCTGLVLSAAVMAGTLATAPVAKADDLVVVYDQSQLLRLPRRATEIIIGNPAIADVSIQSGNLLVVTGKTFGITNIIALDAERNVIQDQRVVVKRDSQKVVNLQRGTERQSYSCTPECHATLIIGDDKKHFDEVARASQVKMKFSEGAADQSTGGAGQ